MTKIPFGKPGEEAKVQLHLEEAPHYAQALGYLCARWAGLEFQIFTLFAALSGAPTVIARAIFYSIESFRSRVEMTKAVGAAVLSGTRHLEELDDVLDLRSGERNQFVHDLWATAQGESRLTVMQFRLRNPEATDDAERVRLKEILDARDRITARAERLNDFIHRIVPELPPLLEKLPRQLSLTLAFSTRDARQRRPQVKPVSPPPPSHVKHSRPKKLSSAQKRALREKGELP